jgi:hypothetical protein
MTTHLHLVPRSRKCPRQLYIPAALPIARLRRWLTPTVTKKKLGGENTYLILLNSFIQNRHSFLKVSFYLPKKNKYYTCSQLSNAAT